MGTCICIKEIYYTTNNRTVFISPKKSLSYRYDSQYDVYYLVSPVGDNDREIPGDIFNEHFIDVSKIRNDKLTELGI